MSLTAPSDVGRDADSSVVLAQEQTQHIRDARAPFDNRIGNLIFRTTDHVDFRVRDSIMKEASPFFDDMLAFSLAEQDDQEYRDGHPVVNVTETSRILDSLLRFCYPVENPVLVSAREICETLAAAQEYLMDYAKREVVAQFAAHAKQEPLVLYALAASCNWRERMKIAAKATLFKPFFMNSFVPEMEFMPAGVYVRLQVYHDACASAAAIAVLREPQNLRDKIEDSPFLTNKSSVWFSCKHYPEFRLTFPQDQIAPTPPAMPKLGHLPFHTSFSKAVDQRPALYIAGRVQMQVVTRFLGYLKAIRDEVRQRPRGQTVREFDGDRYVASGMKDCSTCAYRVLSEMQALKETLAMEVDQAVTAG